MIKVTKELHVVPASLDDRKTVTRRNTCIRDRRYHQQKEFHQRFKQADIKDTLREIYHGKCAFCEQKIFDCIDNNLEDCSSTVEHYRPKSVYYWLAYSWDNLLWCCHRCNRDKDNKFELLGTPVVYHGDFLDAIHTSTHLYQTTEQPKIIHPELENILDKLTFENGVIASDDARVHYTIRTCELDRADLNEKRKKVLDDFINKINAKKVLNQPIDIIVEELLGEFKNVESDFRALRYWILRSFSARF